MAKLPRTGVAYQCLDERDVTLAEIVARLGLKPLTKKAERKIRNRLGFALAKWDEPYTALQIKDVVSSLNAHAKQLDQIDRLGTITRTGFAREPDIAASGQVVHVLISNPAIGSIKAAHEYLRDFCHRAGIIGSACRAAVTSLQSTKGKGGGSPYVWYDEFTAVLLDLCKKNKIEPEARIDRSSGEAVGGLAKMASGFERLLPPNMRSQTPSAMVKRLERSLGRLAQRSSAASRRQRAPSVSC